MLEVRGLGLLDIRTIFGEAAVRRKIRLRLIVHLMRRSTMEQEYERLPLQAITQTILGIEIPKVVIPVAEGRNLAVLTEAAVRSTILRLRGIDSMQAFFERQRALMEQEEQANSGSLGQQQENNAQTGEIAARLSAHQSQGALPQEGSV
jgi:HPr kinase/phosphorylase